MTPLPFANLAICKADHSKNPISSRMSEMIIMATNARVAFQTIFVTSQTFWKFTTPTMSAKMAPPHADKQIDKLRGCHITSVMFDYKIMISKNVYNIYLH